MKRKNRAPRGKTNKKKAGAHFVKKRGGPKEKKGVPKKNTPAQKKKYPPGGEKRIALAL